MISHSRRSLLCPFRNLMCVFVSKGAEGGELEKAEKMKSTCQFSVFRVLHLVGNPQFDALSKAKSDDWKTVGITLSVALLLVNSVIKSNI